MNKIIIAKPGFDARSEINPDNLVFSSDYNTLKYSLSGSYDMTGITTTTNVTIAHNLGYVPFFLVYCNDVLFNPTRYALVEYVDLLITHFLAVRAYADANNLYLSTNIGSGNTTAYTIKFKYKIFANSLGL